jgi:phosphoglycerol transferase MdoB-like AlkP superfamily enzyme
VTPSEPRSHRTGSAEWILAFLLATMAARVALLLLRAADGPGWTHPLAPVAFLHDDLRMTVLFALVALALRGLERRWPGSRPGLALVYGALTFWTAFNVPVARLLSSPMTFAFLHAAGGALGDSIAAYATPLNLGLPATLWLSGLALPRLLRGRWRPSPRALVACAATIGLLLAAGPLALSRVDTLGLHRNAVLALLETTLAHQAAPRAQGLPRLDAPACQSGSALPDLSDLAGVARDRNVVWVILESAGARALGAYGAPAGRTPHLDALASDALVFENAYAAYPESIKGLYSLLCARLPPPGTEASQYGAGRFPCPAVAEQLARAGLRTGLFHSGWFAYLGMDAVVGGRGFARLEDAGAATGPYRSSFGVDDRSTARRALAFIDERPREPFFAVFMPIAGHHPYHAPGDASRPFPEASDREAYVNDIHVADEAFGLLRAGLQARGLDQRTLYLVVGDHGEAFREHPGNVAHALFLYEENVRVPLLVAAPGLWRGQRRVPSLASLIDLAPTTLALAGLPVPGGYAGRSLLDGPARAVPFFTEQAVRRAGLREGRWKLILDQDSGRAQLFDLAADPGELDDRAGAYPERVLRYRACLAR